jgi:hypothetical protein
MMGGAVGVGRDFRLGERRIGCVGAIACAVEATLELRSVGLSIPLVEIYRYIDFEREQAEF